ncbi:hypothetical protein ABPG74_011924 [Tetrahymena malaccensis]
MAEEGNQQQHYFKVQNDIFMKTYDFNCPDQEGEDNQFSTQSYELRETQLGNQITTKQCFQSQNMNKKIQTNGKVFENISENESIREDNQYTLKTNNLIKNILKQYYKFLTKKQNLQVVSEFIFEKPAPYSIKHVKRYFDKINYNNQTIIKIIKHQNYSKGFEYFLTFEALAALQNSKVKNMQEHIDCISYLKECCVNQEQINEINFYKKNKSFFF